MSSLWQRLSARAVEIHVSEHLRERVARGDRLRVKLGLDPTAPDLHVGHLVVLDVLKAFQQEGHTAVLIVGDFTALIGDPSGRTEIRPALSQEQVNANARTYLDQVFKVLDPSRTELHGNAEWLLELNAADVLRLMGKATLQQILQREDFSQRLRDGLAIGFHELLYPLMQGFDSVATRSDVEIGGTDQLFNLLFAREVQRGYGQPPEDIATFPLLEGTDGSLKMSKSAGNYIGLTEPPEEIYGKAMSIPDQLTERYLRLVSELPDEEIQRVLELHPRDAKAALARRLVARLHSEDAAGAAEADFLQRFRHHEAPADIPEHVLSNGLTLFDALVETQLATTRSEARRLFEQGGVRVNGAHVDADYRLRDGDLLQVGKRRFIRIRVE